MSIPRVSSYPRMVRLKQSFSGPMLHDVTAAVRETLGRLTLPIKAGQSVALAVGSRGIVNIAVVARACVDHVKQLGAKPFIFPAMGSHGAATPEGQTDVLAHLGVGEASMGCPVVSRAEVVSLGRTADGIEVYMDAAAHAADAVMVVARVKWHTSFSGRLESGLMKMMAIGLGKFAGAQNYHTHAQQLGLEHVVRTAGRQVLQSGKMIGGVAVVEDAHHDTAHLEAVPAESIEQREEELLARAKSWMPTLPCDVDVLIVDEMGKNISGTGMDAKVVNRGPAGEYNPWPGLPSIRRIFVRELHPLSYGNAIGIGLADVTTDRLARQIDWEPTRINALSASVPSRIRLPTHFPDDRACLRWISATAGKTDPDQVTFGWIRDTLALDRLAISENLRGQIDAVARAVVEGPFEVRWDNEGNLVSPFLSAIPGED